MSLCSQTFYLRYLVLGIGVAALTSGCGSENIQVETQIEFDAPIASATNLALADPTNAHDERTLPVKQATALLKQLWFGTETKISPQKNRQDFLPAPAQKEQELQKLAADLSSVPSDLLPAVARNLAATPPTLWPETVKLLEKPISYPKVDARAVLNLIGGDVPDAYGRFERHWKRKHGYKVRLSDNWFEDLVALPYSRVSSSLRPVYRDLLRRVSLLNVLANAKTQVSEDKMPVLIQSLLSFAYQQGGIFRDEVTRTVLAIGEPTVPALILASKPLDESKTSVQKASYARFLLDKMGRLHPDRALDSAKGDPRIQSSILNAYEQAPDPEAIDSFLRFVDSDNAQLRVGSRRAITKYLSLRDPSLRKKTLRLLGGTTTTAYAELSISKRSRVSLKNEVDQANQASTDPGDQQQLQTIAELLSSSETAPLGAQSYFSWLDKDRREANRLALKHAAALSDPETAARNILPYFVERDANEEGEQMAGIFAAAAEQAQHQGLFASSSENLRNAATSVFQVDSEKAQSLLAVAKSYESKMVSALRSQTHTKNKESSSSNALRDWLVSLACLVGALFAVLGLRFRHGRPN